MITNTGKNILAKYLIGQTSSYASHIAVGCGANPIDIGSPFSDYSDKQTLDFEMFRIPIISRGYVNVDNVPYIVFTGELPTTERYEISEVGIYSAGANPSAGRFDSRNLFSFSRSELWEYHGIGEAAPIPFIDNRLDSQQDNIINVASPSFQASSENITFSEYLDRVNRKERNRFLNNSIFIAGNESNIISDIPIVAASEESGIVTYVTSIDHQLIVGEVVTISGVSPTSFNAIDAIVVASDRTSKTFAVALETEDSYISGGVVTPNHLTLVSGNHIHLTGIRLDLDNNAGSDELKLAFSIVNKTGAPKNSPEASVSQPDNVRVIVEFASSEELTAQFARFEVDLDGSDFADGRYVVVTKKLEELYKTSNFSWDGVSIVKIYPSILFGESPSSNFYIRLDAFRLENITTQNPLYGMTGYSVIKSQDAKTIVKRQNSSNFVEFRFAFDLDLNEEES
jgi:hypothetical protein